MKVLLIEDDDTALAQQFAQIVSDWNIQTELAVDLRGDSCNSITFQIAIAMTRVSRVKIYKSQDALT